MEMENETFAWLASRINREIAYLEDVWLKGSPLVYELKDVECDAFDRLRVSKGVFEVTLSGAWEPLRGVSLRVRRAALISGALYDLTTRVTAEIEEQNMQMREELAGISAQRMEWAEVTDADLDAWEREGVEEAKEAVLGLRRETLDP